LEEITLRHSSWLEPFRRFIKASKNATCVASSGDIIVQRNLFKKIGSNLTLRDRRLNFEPRGAWQLLLQEGFAASPLEVGEERPSALFGPQTEEDIKRSRRDSNPRNLSVERFSRPSPQNDKHRSGNDLEQGSSGAYKPAYKRTPKTPDISMSQMPSELAKIVTVWPGLPEHIKAAIKALVQSAAKQGAAE